ncbi:Protein kinase-like domain [Pseudocohnilembus persalinus]|uniref:non-specific serine/threonine protein kinase n=1 Tax=Pseudocohnilembus persalinus TaxID=266149 RepID=A0A0V0QE01_PSEPJ|nr:Protein kinase-like domain [Pseudocohnilembus persalinus]|eukprot:KRX00352.1 Protein kinase-like domain [Pseudocohnilembus persalinus]
MNLEKKIEKLKEEEQPEDDIFERYSEAEDLEDYKIDGYHPVTLGESFNSGKYKVIQKLGWGHFSTVWLVLNKDDGKYYALKIQKSKENYQEAAEDELDLLSDIKKYREDEKIWKKYIEEFNDIDPEQEIFKKEVGKDDFLHKIYIENKQKSIQLQERKDFKISTKENYCIQLTDNFVHHGINGKHYCSVFELAGPTLLDLINHFHDRDEFMDLWLVKLITRQILTGMVYMHGVCNIIHTDIKPENIMIQFSEDNKDQFIQQLSKYEKQPVSMKILQLLTQNNSAKNKKKYDKKKKKKAAAKAADNQQDGEEGEEKEKDEKNGEQEKENEQKQQDQKLDEQKNENRQGKNEIIEDDEDDQEDRNSEREKKTHHEHQKSQQQKRKLSKQENGLENQKEEKKEQLEKNGEKEEEKKEKENKDGNGSESDSQDGSWSSEGSDSDLYTLNWKNNIKIPLDKNLKIKIVDFGNACWGNEHFTDRIQTREYRSPEAIIQGEYEHNTDIWSLACMVFELITNIYLFKPKKTDEYKKSDHHLCMIQETIGKFPKQFALSGKKSRNYFNKQGQLLRIKDVEELIDPIHKILHEDFELDLEESKKIEEFLLPMLEIDPKKRINAKQALEHPWLWE